jgi:hypothetical protein
MDDARKEQLRLDIQNHRERTFRLLERAEELGDDHRCVHHLTLTVAHLMAAMRSLDS